MLALALLSCNKENEMLPEQKKTDPTEQKILAFKSKIESTDKQNSAETFEADSAVWYIEAALNYTYCEPDVAEIVNIDSVFVTVPVAENGEINFNDVLSAYNEMDSGLNKIFNQTPGDENRIQLADISLVENNNKAYLKKFKLTAFIKKGADTIFIQDDPMPRLRYPFSPNDYWYPMWGQGQCGDYEGQGKGSDAGKLIAEHAGQTIHKYSSPDRFAYHYITDITTSMILPYDAPGYLWTAYLYNSTDYCFSPDDLKYWKDKLVELGSIYRPNGKGLVSYQLDGTSTGEVNELSGKYGFAHYAFISYGIWHEGESAGAEER